MESHEERLHQMIQQSKEKEAKETSRRKQLELAEARKKQQREEKMAQAMGLSPSSSGGPSGYGSSAPGFETSMDGDVLADGKFDRMRRQEDLLTRQAALVAAAANARSAPEPVATWNPSMNADAVDYSAAQSASAPKKGMALGGRRRPDQ